MILLRHPPRPDRAGAGARYELVATSSQLCLACCKVCVRWLWSGLPPAWNEPTHLPLATQYGLAPIRERHSAAGPGRRAIERLIIDDGHLEPDLVHGARDRNPILQLGAAGAEVVGRNRDQRVGILTLHGVEEAAVKLLIHHEMGHPAGADDGDAQIGVPRRNGVGQRLAEREAAPHA